MPILQRGCGGVLRRPRERSTRTRGLDGKAHQIERRERRQLGLVVGVVELRGEMIGDEVEQLRLEAAAGGIADVDRAREYQRREKPALLHVMPLDIVNRG